MKMLFWNIRDWGQEGRRRQLKDFINREGVDMIGVQETIMDDFSMNELEQIGGKVDFVWNWLSAKGHSGGILLGIKEDVVEVGVVDQGEFFLGALLRHKKDGFKWEVIVIYGPACHEKSEEFLEELKNKCLKTEVLVVIGGDFNLICCGADKNNSNIDWRMVNLFNSFIADQQLQELKRGGHKFTWTIKQKGPVMVNMDIILIAPDGGSIFPCVALVLY
jgi:exonuclease III